MSKETLDLMLGLNRQELEIQIALQCAPLLTGRKISNLLTVDKRFRSAVLRLFRSSAVSCYVLYESDDRITFLLYVRKKLEAYLRTEKVKKLMEEFGCSGCILSKILYRVSERYRAHMEGKGDFLMRSDYSLDIRRKMSLVLLKTVDKIRCISDTGRYIPIWKNAGRYLPDTIRQGKK